MATEIRVPALGESVTEATVGRWFKKAGERVKADEPIVELETDKVTLEVNAPVSGVLAAIATKDGETVSSGALLGEIQAVASAAPPKDEATRVPPPAAPVSPAPALAPAPATLSPLAMPASPAAAKIAADHGLDPATLEGSGKRGQVLKGDVLDYVAKPPAPAAPPPSPAPAPDEDREERVPMTRLRQTIARRLKDAQNTAAMLTTFNEA
ncbi:MAG: biotin/lipoyl-containing protein, partial [Methylocella sp.]